MKKTTVTKAKAKQTNKQVRAKTVKKEIQPAPQTKAVNPLAPEVGTDLFRRCNHICTRCFNSYETFSEREFTQAADLARIPKDVFKAFFDEWIESIERCGFASQIKPAVYPWKMWQRNQI